MPEVLQRGGPLPAAVASSPLVRGAAPEPVEKLPPPKSPPEVPEAVTAPKSARALPIGLDTVLQMAEGQNGQVALAREKVREAYADRDLAKAAWLPSINVGVSYFRHEGGVQDFDGQLIHSSTGALFSGLDFYSRLDLREAVFRQVDAERKVWQQKGELSRITNEVLLEATTTYIDLLAARTGEAVVLRLLKFEEEVLEQAREIAKPGREPGTRFQVEAIEAEVYALRQITKKLRQQGDAAAAKLAYLLGLAPDVQLVPVDGRLVAFELVDASRPSEELVAQALASGPGVRELERLLAVVNAGRERAKGPGRLIPILEMRMLEGGFGAAPGARLDWDNRWDLGLQARWNLTDLCTAPKVQRVAETRLNQLHLTYKDVRDKLALGVQEARDASVSGREEIRLAGEAVRHANEGYELSRKRLKENVPGSTTTEVLQFIRGLQAAYLNYINVIRDYDKAQLRLLVLLGDARQGTTAVPCER
jgi:outer membrane protein TolC